MKILRSLASNEFYELKRIFGELDTRGTDQVPLLCTSIEKGIPTLFLTYIWPKYEWDKLSCNWIKTCGDGPNIKVDDIVDDLLKIVDNEIDRNNNRLYDCNRNEFLPDKQASYDARKKNLVYLGQLKSKLLELKNK